MKCVLESPVQAEQIELYQYSYLIVSSACSTLVLYYV